MIVSKGPWLVVDLYCCVRGLVALRLKQQVCDLMHYIRQAIVKDTMRTKTSLIRSLLVCTRRQLVGESAIYKRHIFK